MKRSLICQYNCSAKRAHEKEYLGNQLGELAFDLASLIETHAPSEDIEELYQLWLEKTEDLRIIQATYSVNEKLI